MVESFIFKLGTSSECSYFTGKTLFPAMGLIFSAWETFSIINDVVFTDTDVELSDVRILEELDLTIEAEKNLLILIQPGTGYFQV